MRSEPYGAPLADEPCSDRHARHGHDRHASSRGHRAGLRYPPAPVPRLRNRNAEHPRADAARHVGRPGEHHAADHGPGVGVRHDRQDARTARHLRVPQPEGQHLRGPVDRNVERRDGACRLGRLGGQGPSIAADRRSPLVPAAEGVPRLAGRMLPHATLGHILGVPGGARDRDRGRAREWQRLHLRHPRLPSRRLRRRARTGVHDDRTSIQGRTQARRREAVGLLHAVRDRAGPTPSRVLAALGSPPPAVRGGEQVRDGVPGLLPVPGRRDRQAPRGAARGRDHDRDERPWRAPDDGGALLQRLADPGGLPGARGAAVARDPRQGGGDRLESDRRLGRRWLLRSVVPERQGPRTRGDRRAWPV